MRASPGSPRSRATRRRGRQGRRAVARPRPAPPPRARGCSVWANSSRKSATRSPMRAEQPGRGRHDHRERAHELGDGVRVERARAAVGDEREVARVVAALDGDEPQRARHVLVHDREDALGRLLDGAEPHRVGDRLHGRAGRVDVERHLAAEQLRREVPEHDVRVGDRRQLAAPAVGGGPGRGARPTRGRREAPSSAAGRGRSSRRPRRPCGRRPTGRGSGSARSPSRARSTAGRSGRARRRWTSLPCRT